MRILSAIAVLLCGCVLIPPAPSSRNGALLNDLNSDVGYDVVEVDGKPAKRASSPIHTVLPDVLLEPGEHTLTLKPKRSEEKPITKITVTVEAGKAYRLANDGEAVSVIEEPWD